MVKILWKESLTAWLLLGAITFGLSGCLSEDKPKSISFETEYQAVFLQNGQLFFGKLEGFGSDYPVLRDVHYIQQQMNPETKQIANVVLKRSLEPHAPDRMILNARQIAFVEPVGAVSGIAKFLVGNAPAGQK